MLEEQVKLVKAVIFDMGQTLVAHRKGLTNTWDDYHKKFLKQLFDIEVPDEDFAKVTDEAWALVEKRMMQRATGPYEKVTTEDWHIFSKHILTRVGVTGNLDEKTEDYQRLWGELRLDDDDAFSLVPGAEKTLRELKKRGYKLGLASNRDTDPIDQLRYLNVSQSFDSVQWALTPGYAKPSPYMLIMNANEMNLNPMKCAFVGDYKMDVEAAQRAGMVPILINKISKEDPSELGDIIVIQSLLDLLDIFRRV
jgi:HAD superfamily hydrolase (TIGR01662 family)